MTVVIRRLAIGSFAGNATRIEKASSPRYTARKNDTPKVISRTYPVTMFGASSGRR